jgi:hypothetical protein
MESTPTPNTPNKSAKKKKSTATKPLNVDKIMTAFPGYYDPKKAPEKQSSERQQHMIYQAFNDKFSETVDILKIKLPHNARLYTQIQKAIVFYISRDVTFLMNTFNQDIKGKLIKLPVLKEQVMKTVLESLVMKTLKSF